jgi:hypothetical protein
MEQPSEGVHPRWESLAEGVYGRRRLVIERARGDGTVEKFTCAESEAATILDFLFSQMVLGHHDWQFPFARHFGK